MNALCVCVCVCVWNDNVLLIVYSFSTYLLLVFNMNKYDLKVKWDVNLMFILQKEFIVLLIIQLIYI
jgi:hypothetical protein